MDLRRSAIEMSDVEKDAKRQLAKSVADRKSIGVHSAKPTVITGSEDATEHKTPPGTKPKDCDIDFPPTKTAARCSGLIQTGRTITRPRIKFIS